MTVSDEKRASSREYLSAATAAHSKGDLAAAQDYCERLIEEDPTCAEALDLLGVVCCQLGDPQAGIVYMAKAAALAPDNAGYLNNLGTGLSSLGREQDALLTYTRALELDPMHATTHNNVATIYRNQGHLEKAADHYQKAIELRQDYAEAQSNYGNVLLDLGRVDEASEILESAIRINPDYPFSYNNLGIVRQRQGRYSDAETVLKKSIELAPDFADPYSNLAEVFKETGRADEAIVYYQKSLERAPDRASVHSNYVYALNNLESLSPKELFQAHCQWDQIHGTHPVPETGYRVGENEKIRIGFVSADFRQHSVSYFLEDILEHLDRSRFDVYCYAAGHIEDQVTERLKGTRSQWRKIVRLSDQEACALIRRDRIDVLIDLSGHTMGNRLQMFALKPAPLQISYLGYPATTGLGAMDARLVDQWTDPVGQTEGFHRETLQRIEGGFLCYRAPSNAPDVGPLPCQTNGYVTFGSCNNLAKLTPVVLQCWAEILSRVPGSKLMLKGKALADAGVRSRFEATFSGLGIDAERLLFKSWISGDSHLSIYNQMDIALDPFPYNGTTTTCETLWMGVPTVTLEGQAHAARVGISLLNVCGLGELIAPDRTHYISLAVNLATAPERLQTYRRDLRSKMMASRLCNGADFTLAFEKALSDLITHTKDGETSP